MTTETTTPIHFYSLSEDTKTFVERCIASAISTCFLQTVDHLSVPTFTSLVDDISVKSFLKDIFDIENRENVVDRLMTVSIREVEFDNNYILRFLAPDDRSVIIGGFNDLVKVYYERQLESFKKIHNELDLTVGEMISYIHDKNYDVRFHVKF